MTDNSQKSTGGNTGDDDMDEDLGLERQPGDETLQKHIDAVIALLDGEEQPTPEQQQQIDAYILQYYTVILPLLGEERPKKEREKEEDRTSFFERFMPNYAIPDHSVERCAELYIERKILDE